MPRRRRHEEHVNHEAWAIPYGDLVTLLLAFFVTMYAMSTVNQGKYRVLSDSLSAAFRGEPRTPQPVVLSNVVQISGDLPVAAVNRMMSAGMPVELHAPPAPAQSAESADQSGADQSAAPADASDGEHAVNAAAAPARGVQLSQVEAEVGASLAELTRDNSVRIQRRGKDLEVQISTDVLFGSGEAELGGKALAALRKLAGALGPFPNGVRVEGHTDDRPIRTAAFRSNWELSAARAASVVRLLADNGVAPERMAVVGYGEFAPIQPNTSADGRNANRRVVIMILGEDGAAAVGATQ